MVKKIGRKQFRLPKIDARRVGVMASSRLPERCGPSGPIAGSEPKAGSGDTTWFGGPPGDWTIPMRGGVAAVRGNVRKGVGRETGLRYVLIPGASRLLE